MLRKLAVTLLSICFLCLCACGKQPSQEIAWQRDLTKSGVQLSLRNCTVQESTVSFWPKDGEAKEPEQLLWLQADNIPVLLADSTAQVTFDFAEPYQDGYRYYDTVHPSKADYVQTERGDGMIEYQVDTVYNYYIQIETPQGTDCLILTCTRQID